MIGIIDYGAGNLLSVKKAFDYLGVESKIITDRKEFNNLDRVVLPGVGAFGAAVNKLKSSGFFPLIQEYLTQDKPFLGICLGMQMLMESSEETPGIEGLGRFKGDNKRFTQGKIPQIGWNQIEKQKESQLLKGIPEGAFFYFVHGFYVAPQEEEVTAATTEYYIHYTSMVESGPVAGCQFHPEKSGDNGLQLLRNWVQL